MFSELLIVLFQKYGWTSKKVDKNWVISSFETDESPYTLYAGLSENWFTVTVNTYISLDPKTVFQPVLFELLRLNFNDEIIKFCINEKNFLIIRVDQYFQQELSYETFEYALNSVCFRIDEYIDKVMAIKFGKNKDRD